MKDQPLSIGTDIVDVARFENFDFGGRLAAKLFTEQELTDCRAKPHPAASLAARFAAKEAVIKAIEETVEFNLIEITNDEDGKPQVIVWDEAVQASYVIQISLSHTKDLALAMCLAVKK